jgi:polysaccharide export outer membrane protein
MNAKLCAVVMVLLTASVAMAQGQSTPSSADTRSYLLGPGDVVEIKVFGQSDLNTNAQVDSDGYLSSLAFLEPINVKCRTEREVQRSVQEAYKRLLKDPQVSVRILERNSRPPATVFGAVRQASKVPMQRTIRLNELVAASGGFTESAAGTIQILHTEPVMCPSAGEQAVAQQLDGTMLPMLVVKISDLKKGTNSANPIIRPGDLVLVPAAEPIYINGSVSSPGGVLLREQLTLSRALAMVGGTRREADLSKVTIYRQKPGTQEQEIIKVDFEAVKKNRHQDVILRPYDVVDVPERGTLRSIDLKGLVLSLLTGGVRTVVTPL